MHCVFFSHIRILEKCLKGISIHHNGHQTYSQEPEKSSPELSTTALATSTAPAIMQVELGTVSLGSTVLMIAASLTTQQAQFVLATFTKFRRCKTAPVSQAIGFIASQPSTTHQLPG